MLFLLLFYKIKFWADVQDKSRYNYNYDSDSPPFMTCTETHSYLRVNSANILHNRHLLAVSCGKLWIFVEFRLEVIPVI